MTTQTEALKLALEALETLVRLAEHEGWEGFDKQYNAITAIKEALAKPEQEPVAQWQKRNIEQTDGMWCDTTEADAKWWLNQNGLHGWEVRKVYTTPPQRKEPEQESAKNFEVCEIGARFDGASQQHIPFVVIEFEPVPVNSGYDAKGWKDRDLFVSDIKNTPPQRKPLTDKQLNIIGSRWHLNLLGTDEKAELFEFARAIEAAHGIKGDA